MKVDAAFAPRRMAKRRTCRERTKPAIDAQKSAQNVEERNEFLAV